ncbi:Arc15 protein [Saccharomycopsis crataegensis]|uniref:Actin-related protein 2/3 complex subunit 5 n=1 Tax=Saccharomycopsis crataegensis TaxID=43959 RepID=A0AAV5QGS2_9ASCO|nr:Arc15 protein [Saccharomycopsis crataegensis]
MDTDWRRIDIDALEEGNRLTAADLVPPAEPVSYEDVAVINQQVKSLLAKGENYDALAYSLSSPPYGGDDQVKALHLSTVFDILKTTKTSSVAKLVGELSTDEQDVLVKYLYKLMSLPQGQQSSGVLLAWLDKVVEVAGNGPIIRYLNDRRTV